MRAFPNHTNSVIFNGQHETDVLNQYQMNSRTKTNETPLSGDSRPYLGTACLVSSLKRKLIMILSILSLCYVNVAHANTEHTHPPARKNILILLTFPHSIPWSKGIMQGVEQGIRAQDLPVNIFIESLGGLQLETDADLLRYHDSIRDKYVGIEFDGILADSKYAHEFVNWLHQQDYALSALPKVSFYLHHDADSLTPDKLFQSTIAVEKYSLRQTIELVVKQNPELERVFVNRLNNEEFSQYYEVIQKFLSEISPSTQLTLINSEPWAILYNSVSQLTERDALIFLPTLKRTAEQVIVPALVVEELAALSKAPVYSFWQTFAGHGIVGGNLLNPEIAAANMLTSLLNKIEQGQFSEKVTISEWVFDQQALEKYDLSIPSSIKKYRLLNEEKHFWNEYPLEVALITIGLLSLTVLVFLFRQKQLKAALGLADQAKADAIVSSIEAKRLLQAKSRFLATVSHEVRTPISGILGVINMLKDSSLNNEQQRYLGMAKYSTDTLLRTINDILDFSKLESNKLKFQAKVFNLAELLLETTEHTRLLAKGKPIQIIENISHSCHQSIEADPDRIQQVLYNLVNNAVKFTSSGSITIGAKIINKIDEHSNHELHLWVKDTGIGIAPDKQKQVFEPFVQVGDSYQRDNQGTGLGLAICHELVSSMGGNIQLNSEINTGSEFSLFMPVTLINSNDTSTQVNSLESSELPTPNKMRVLLVEDNEINQEVIQYQITSRGIHCDIAENGKECLHKLQNAPNKYDIVLMDIQMPVMDGYKASEAIRQGQAGQGYRKIPIIALTAHVSLEEVQRGRAAGMNTHLNKPVEVDTLVRTLFKELGE